MAVEVLFLGTGIASADGGRSHACILLTAPLGRILLDCGSSAMPALARACDPSTIDAVAITHLHGDHFGGLPYLAMQQRYAPRSRPLVVGGPPSLERRFTALAVTLFDDFFEPPLPYPLPFTVLTPVPAHLGPAEVSAHPVVHVASSEPHGLRVRIGGKLIAYSGDAAWTDALPALADGADLFICEASTFSTVWPMHLSARELVAHRTELHWARLIVTHLGRKSIDHLSELGVDHADDGMVLRL